MDFRTTFVISLIITLIITNLLVYFLLKKAKREKKSIRNIPLRAFLYAFLPFIIFLMITADISIVAKIIGVILATLGGIAQIYNLRAQRKAFRKIFDLPPEDEDTGEVIKDKKELL
jgi:hypothetical protein